MFKKTISLLLIFMMIFSAVPEIIAQDDESAPMWEMMMLTPDNTKLKELSQALAKHNKNYHKEGPHKASVYNVVTGPDIGKIIWQMGPLTFADLDTRPSKGGHDEDWQGNVMPYVKKMTDGEYWTQDNELSNVGALSEEDASYPLLYIRYFEADRDHGYAIDHLLDQMSATVKAMEGDNPWGVYDNEFRQGFKIGRHLAWVSFHKNWAEMDEDSNFKATFTKIHGDDSWQPFVEGLGDAFSDSWDVIWEYNSKLSGDE